MVPGWWSPASTLCRCGTPKTHTLHLKLDHGSDVGRGPHGAAFVPAGLLVVGGDQVLWRVWDLATRQPRVVVAPSMHSVNRAGASQR
jgi:hypothetical protein